MSIVDGFSPTHEQPTADFSMAAAVLPGGITKFWFGGKVDTRDYNDDSLNEDMTQFSWAFHPSSMGELLGNTFTRIEKHSIRETTVISFKQAT